MLGALLNKSLIKERFIFDSVSIVTASAWPTLTGTLTAVAFTLISSDPSIFLVSQTNFISSNVYPLS